MIITAAQCRAARALLDWSQPDLAMKSGIHVQTISNFEHGNGSPTNKTLKTIRDTFETSGINFTEQGGVNPNVSEIYTYRGHIGFGQFRQDVLSDAKKSSLDICVNNVDEKNFSLWGGIEMNQKYREEMAKIKNLKSRIIIKRGDTYLAASSFAKYRWAKEDDFGDIPLYLYGDKTALINFKKDDVDVFVITSKDITNYFRKRFQDAWNNAEEIKIPIKKV